MGSVHFRSQTDTRYRSFRSSAQRGRTGSSVDTALDVNLYCLPCGEGRSQNVARVLFNTVDPQGFPKTETLSKNFPMTFNLQNKHANI